MRADEIERVHSVPVPELLRHKIVRRSGLLEACYSAWSDLRSGSGVPALEELEASRTAHFADHMMLLDSHGPGAIRLREGGRVIRALLGTEARGLPLRALFHVTGRRRVLDSAERVFDEPAVVTLDLAAHSLGDGMPLTAQLLLLPLRDRAGRVAKALGCVALRGPVGPGPHRFHLTGQEVAPIAPCPPRPAPRRSGAGAPHLRLVT
jgi:hypothetical protein